MKKLILSLCFLSILYNVSAVNKTKQWFSSNNLIETGVYYYPEHWKESQWDRDFKLMHDLGFQFTHFAEFAWAQLEPEEGKYDFAWLDRAVALAAKYHLKVIMCTSTATPPVWLSRKYPEILLKDEKGFRLDHGARQQASFSSPLYRKLAYEMIEKLGQHYGNDQRVVGWQLDNEPAVQFDYNDAAQNEFRQFLVDKYHNDIHQLNDSWGTSFWSEVYSSFDQIDIPQMSQMFMNHHQILDYHRFAAKETYDFLNNQCLLIKKYVKNQWVTSNYIPDYSAGHIGMSKDLDFVTYTRYMVYGENEGIGDRGFRVGDPLRIAYANDFFRPINGTYGVMELQPGQVNWGGINPQPLPGAVRLWLWNVFAGGSDFVCTYRFRQPLYGTEQYHNGIIGTDGVTVLPGGREYEQFMKEIASLTKVAKEKDDVPADYSARRAAILYNPENSWSIDRQKQTRLWDTDRHIRHYYQALKSFGAPVDIINENQDFSKYKIMIVPAYQMADKALIAKWKEYAEQGGNLVITCRTAQKDRYGRLPEMPFGGMLTDLTGDKIDFYDHLLDKTSPGKVSFDGNDYNWDTWGEVLTTGGDTKVWEKYDSEFYKGKPAVTYRKIGKGSVIYVGVDTEDGQMEASILYKLYSTLNIPVMNLPYGVTIEYRNGLGIVMNYSDKPYTFKLPEGTKTLIGNPEIPTAGVLVFTCN